MTGPEIHLPKTSNLFKETELPLSISLRAAALRLIQLRRFRRDLHDQTRQEVC